MHCPYIFIHIYCTIVPTFCNEKYCTIFEVAICDKCTKGVTKMEELRESLIQQIIEVLKNASPEQIYIALEFIRCIT